MDISSLKSQIKNNSLDNFYIFYGPEVEIMKVYIKQMSKVTGYEVIRLDSAVELAQKINSNSLLKNAQICVLNDSRDIILDDSTNTLISNIIAQSTHICILIYSTLDKRSKFYKTYQDYSVEFQYMKPDILAKYVKREIDLSVKYIDQLIEICENDYSRILLEIDKIKTFQQAVNISTNEAYKKLLESGVIYQPPYDAVFDFVDAVLKNKCKLAYILLNESYESGEATFVLISNLYNSTKQLLQVQSYEGDNLAKATGLTAFQIKLAKERINYNDDGRLVYLMRLIRLVERGIKVGEIEESIAMEYILARFWG